MLTFVVFIYVGALIIAAYPVTKMIGWYLEGGVEPVMVIASIGLYLGLMVALITAPTGFKVIIFLILFVSALAMPWLGELADEIALKRMEEDQYRSYIRALEEDPRNATARIALAEVLHKRGNLDQAIEHLDWTLQAYPSMSLRLRPRLESWKRERQRVGVPPPIICHRCHAENPAGAFSCHQCGRSFGAASGIQQRIQEEGGTKVVMRGWIILAAALNMGLFLLIVATRFVPFIVIAALLFATAIVAGWLFLRWVGGDMGQPAD